MARKGQIGLDADMAQFISKSIKTGDDKVENLYTEVTGNKFQNISRKVERFMREELSTARKDVLKQVGLTEAQCSEAIARVQRISAEKYGKSAGNYVWVQA